MAKHTLDEFTTLVQFIFDHLSDFPALLETPGIFAQSGSKLKTDEMIEKILKHEYFAHTRYGPHEYMGALKSLLTEDIVIDLNQAQPLIEALTHINLADNPSLQNALNAFNTYLSLLANSQNKKEVILAHALYSYCHFAQEATQYHIKNKMNADKISMILGSLFQRHLMPNANLSHVSPLFNGLFKYAIETLNFELPFEIKYPNQQLTHAVSSIPQVPIIGLSGTFSQKYESTSDEEDEDDSTLEKPKKKKQKKGGKKIKKH